MLSVLARYPVIFGHIVHTAMAAEAPGLHRGDLGCLEEVRMALLELLLLATGIAFNNNYYIALIQLLWPGSWCSTTIFQP